MNKLDGHAKLLIYPYGYFCVNFMEQNYAGSLRVYPYTDGQTDYFLENGLLQYKMFEIDELAEGEALTYEY